jgi:hypothetical protein
LKGLAHLPSFALARLSCQDARTFINGSVAAGTGADSERFSLCLGSHLHGLNNGTLVVKKPRPSAPVVIRRAARRPNTTRTHAVTETEEPEAVAEAQTHAQTTQSTVATPTSIMPPESDQHHEGGNALGHERQNTSEELARIRWLLRPLPIPGVENWGIPPEVEGPCDAEVEVRCSVMSSREKKWMQANLSMFDLTSLCIRCRDQPLNLYLELS